MSDSEMKHQKKVLQTIPIGSLMEYNFANCVWLAQ